MGLLGPINTRTYIRILYIGGSQDADTVQGRRKVNPVGGVIISVRSWNFKDGGSLNAKLLAKN